MGSVVGTNSSGRGGPKCCKPSGYLSSVKGQQEEVPGDNNPAPAPTVSLLEAQGGEQGYRDPASWFGYLEVQKRVGMLGLVSWKSGLRICGAHRLPGSVGVQRDSLIFRVRGRPSGGEGYRKTA